MCNSGAILGIARKLKHPMFPAIMSWPMTLAPTNEAIRRENFAKKNIDTEKINRHNPGGH
jgi:hypothetical protein